VPTLLIIDDSKAHRAQILEALAPTAIFDRVVEAEDGLQGLKCLLNESVDVVLCDLEMPTFDGEKLLRVKQATPGSSNIPFVFLTGTSDLDCRIRLLESGAADLIIKPFHPGELVARLRLHLKVKRLQDELRDKNEALARLSTTDTLTGLRTRRYTDEVLAIEFLRARRYHSPLNVVMADLDHFKLVNDTYGHPAGDAVLRGVSSALLSSLRATDVAGRYGGDEILVVLAQSDLEGGLNMAERWRRAVCEDTVAGPDGQRLAVEVSIGIASYHPGMGAVEDLVAAADAALYRAKESGRNRVEVAPASVEREKAEDVA
jgi:two-component system cell cycle response regulator